MGRTFLIVTVFPTCTGFQHAYQISSEMFTSCYSSESDRPGSRSSIFDILLSLSLVIRMPKV